MIFDQAHELFRGLADSHLVWSIEEHALKNRMLRGRRPAVDLQSDSKFKSDGSPRLVTELAGTVAVIPLCGVMVPSPYYDDDVPTHELTAAVEAAVANDLVTAILFRVDSPGGSVAGLAQLADAVAAARLVKPIYAQIEGLAASAAYYTIAQCTAIYAQRMDLVGSIGTRMMAFDFSKLFGNIGVEAVPIDTGAYKSTGAFGAELTDDQRNYLQGLVDGFQADFAQVVERGRNLTGDRFKAVADGRVHLADAAQQLGLIDGVQTFAATLSQLSAAESASTPGGSRMSTTQNAPAAPATPEQKPTELKASPATPGELKAALPSASKEFLWEQVEKKATVEEAVQAHSELLAQENAELKAQLAQQAAAASATAPQKKATGNQALADLDEDGDSYAAADAATEFHSKVDTLVDRGMPRFKAVSTVARKHPELREAMVAQANG